MSSGTFGVMRADGGEAAEAETIEDARYAAATLLREDRLLGLLRIVDPEGRVVEVVFASGAEPWDASIPH